MWNFRAVTGSSTLPYICSPKVTASAPYLLRIEAAVQVALYLCQRRFVLDYGFGTFLAWSEEGRYIWKRNERKQALVAAAAAAAHGG